MSYDVPAEFLSVDGGADFCRRLVAVNVTSVNAVTRLVLPDMVRRGRGAVVNVGSVLAQIPAPYYAVYSACKAYVDSFSRNLNLEYGDRGIVVQCVLPGGRKRLVLVYCSIVI